MTIKHKSLKIKKGSMMPFFYLFLSFYPFAQVITDGFTVKQTVIAREVKQSLTVETGLKPAST